MPIEEADDLVELVEVRPRRRLVGPRVDPVADDRVRRCRAAGLHPERRIDVGVVPAADVEDRNADGVVVRRQRALAPIRPVGLVTEPREEPGRGRLESRPPVVPPGPPSERCVRRHRVHRDLADRVFAELADGHAPTAVMDVVEIAVVGRHDRHDRLEGGWPEHRDLDRGEAAVGDAPHADVPVAPRLGRKPGDGLDAVVGLVGAVFIDRDPARRSGAADVEAAQRIPARCEPRPACLVGCGAPMVLAVRDHLEDRRDGVIGGRPPEVGRQLDAVAHRQAHVARDDHVEPWLARGPG